jgi:hypothetical protein
MDPCAPAALSDPGGISTPGPYRRLNAAACNVTTQAPSMRKFRGSISRLTPSLSTLRSAQSPMPHARLASGWWPTCAGQVSHLPGPLRKVSIGRSGPPRRPVGDSSFLLAASPGRMLRETNARWQACSARSLRGSRSSGHPRGVSSCSRSRASPLPERGRRIPGEPRATFCRRESSSCPRSRRRRRLRQGRAARDPSRLRPP